MELPDIENDRARLGWWLFVAVLFAAAVFIAHSFVGMLTLGIFGYYATRPIYERFDDHISNDSVAAGLTVTLVIVPVIAVAIYAAFRVFQQVETFLGGGGPGAMLRQFVNLDALTPSQRASLEAVIQNPQSLLSAPRQTLQEVLVVGMNVISGVIGALVLIALALMLSYALLVREEQLSASLTDLLGGTDTAAYAYAVAVDEDLQSVFFGNLLFVIAMTIVAVIAYEATNLLAPQPLHVPFTFTLAFLTGVASLIPIVVGKIIYVPVVGYLGFQAVRNGTGLTFVAGALVAYFLLLDILPQTFLQPYITGRQLDMVLLMFGYILGPILFGWYGFFFLPIVFIVMLEAIRIPLPELLHGEPLTTGVSLGESVGTDPESADDVAAEEPAGDDPTAGDDSAASSE